MNAPAPALDRPFLVAAASIPALAAWTGDADAETAYACRTAISAIRARG